MVTSMTGEEFMYRRWINVSVITLTAVLMAASGTLADDIPTKTFEATIDSADASSNIVMLKLDSVHDITAFMRPGDAVEVAVTTNGVQRMYPATVRSTDPRPQTVALKVNSIRDITAFMRPGDPAEVVVGGTAAATHPERAFPAKIESVNAGSKTVTMRVDSMHDISAFIQRGDTVEIIVSE